MPTKRTKPLKIEPELAEFATAAQRRYVDAVNRQGSMRQAAKQLGCNVSLVSRAIQRLRERAAARGYSPDTLARGLVAPGQESAGESVLYDEHGNVKLRWLKTRKSKDERQPLIEAMQELLEGWNQQPGTPDPGIAEPVRDDLMCVIPIGDFHFGMYAWGLEAGQDFDLKIAERNWRTAFDNMVRTMPACELGVVLNLGDLTHGDNSKNVTPRAANQLDIDTRHPHVTRVALRCMLYAAHRVREKCQRVKVRNNIGNHDQETSQAISLMMEAHFNGIEIEGIEKPEKSPSRIEICTSPKDLEIVAEFGQVLITSSHGEYTKPAEIPGLLLDDFPEQCGRTHFRYHHSGHVHHKNVHTDIPGLHSFESHRTLSPKDKHAANKYRAPQSIELITYHRHFGEINRSTHGIELIHAIEKGAVLAPGSS